MRVPKFWVDVPTCNEKSPFFKQSYFFINSFSHMYNNSCIITKSINIISSKRKCCHVKRIYISTCSESYRTGGISWSKFTLRSMIRGGEVTQWIKMFKKVPEIKELFLFSKYGQAKGRPVVLFPPMTARHYDCINTLKKLQLFCEVFLLLFFSIFKTQE